MMLYHYPRWLLFSSFSLLLAACYGWFGSHQWPMAAFAIGTTILVCFLLQSNAFLTDETKRLDENQTKLISNQTMLIEGFRVVQDQLGITVATPKGDDVPPMVRPVVVPSLPARAPILGPDGLPIPVPIPVSLGTDDRRERALNTEALQKDSASVDRAAESVDKLTKAIDRARDGR